MAEGNEPKTYSEQEYEALRSQLEDVKKQLESYQETDIEAIKASAEDFKKKWEQSEQERKDFEHRTKISAYVMAARAVLTEVQRRNLLLDLMQHFHHMDIWTIMENM